MSIMSTQVPSFSLVPRPSPAPTRLPIVGISQIAMQAALDNSFAADGSR